ncbi:permease [Gloeobacter kilaueensis JS1]|uniref:Probable membrane transporter protein n=2 Tax=Gloeobacter TaxID=33071 RepID=U5QLK3_GLOK1|nr:sulfite exporter TauE/SafE family protein [Gloeobacter kilaueensis]AGY58560.1 permease [Gloeobacter kilaueensis JS1]
MDIKLSLASLLVGIVVGMTGVGGAALMTPLLILVFNIPGSIAIGSDVVSATLMKVVGGYKHWQQGTVDLEVVRWLALGSIPGSFAGIGAIFAARSLGIAQLDMMLIHVVGFVLIGVSSLYLGRLIFSRYLKFKLPDSPKFDLSTTTGRILSMVVGFILGAIVGLTSVGSGSLFAVALLLFFRLDPWKLVGTDIVQAAILLIFTSIGHASLGNINWQLVLPIWLGTVPGVLIGAKLCPLVPKTALQVTLYSLLLMVGWQMLTKI